MIRRSDNKKANRTFSKVSTFIVGTTHDNK